MAERAGRSAVADRTAAVRGQRVVDGESHVAGAAGPTDGGVTAAAVALGIEALSIGVLGLDRDGYAIAANHAWTQLSGLTIDRSLGDGWLAGLTATDRAGVRRHVERVAAGGAASGDDYLVTTTSRWLRFRFHHDAGAGDTVCVVVAATDVTEDRVREADLAHRATHDALTGLVNRDEQAKRGTSPIRPPQ